MRIAFVGAGEMTVRTAEMLIDQGHEVVIIEKKEELIKNLSEELDCAFLHGDGSNPRILAEASPASTDFLFCLSDKDQHNIIASLVGNSLGFSRVVVAIEDPEYESICAELGLEEVVVPSRTISRYLADKVRGVDTVELSTVLRQDARFFSFRVGEEDAGVALEDLELPGNSAVICMYRDEQFFLASEVDTLSEGDELVVLARSESLAQLRERWRPHTGQQGGSSGQDQGDDK